MTLYKLKNGDIKLSVERIDGCAEIILTIQEINLFKNSIDSFLNNVYSTLFIIEQEAQNKV